MKEFVWTEMNEISSEEEWKDLQGGPAYQSLEREGSLQEIIICLKLDILPRLSPRAGMQSWSNHVKSKFPDLLDKNSDIN